MILGALAGLVGLVCIFWPEFKEFGFTGETFYGVLLALAGAYCFSWGNYVSTYFNRQNIPLLASTLYGMVYAIILLNIFCFIMHSSDKAGIPKMDDGFA